MVGLQAALERVASVQQLELSASPGGSPMSSLMAPDVWGPHFGGGGGSANGLERFDGAEAAPDAGERQLFRDSSTLKSAAVNMQP